ncbi:MAG: hypothetical protein P9M14_03915 [Candidatus Alcyoniella australis]|nr:hypothetical protein [Candidatus Alcyoniella australis]
MDHPGSERFERFWREELGIKRPVGEAYGRCYLPLAQIIARRCEACKPLLVGICGSQGSGKSTWARALEFILEHRGLRAVSLSLDDLYLPWEEREKLQRQQPDNPYYAIHRGNPGTHDLELGINVLQSLSNADDQTVTRLPRFDKSLRNGRGEPLPMGQWPVVRGRPDVVLFEGWFVGARPLERERFEALKARHPQVLKYEAEYDPAGEYGWEINLGLEQYRPLFELLQMLILLKVPSLDKVVQWRQAQERRLISDRGQGMTPEQVERFVQPFLLLTALHCLDAMGDLQQGHADVIVQIGDDQLPERLHHMVRTDDRRKP